MKGKMVQFENHTQLKGEKIMKNKMSKILKNEKGLTLIELLAVIVILAIISAIAIPAIGNIIDNSRYNAVKADAINVLNAANLYYTDNPDATTAVTVANLKSDKYLDSSGKITEGSVSIAVPHALTITTAITYGSSTVTFTGATIETINADKSKGSSGKPKTITGTAKANNDGS